MTQDTEKTEKKLPEHSNFWALLYVWSVTALFLAGIGGLVYWLFFR